MRILKNQFLLFAVSLAIVSTSYGFLPSKQSVLNHQPIVSIKGGGSIVMTDVIMLVVLNNPNDNITTIQIVNNMNQLAFETHSCTNNHCEQNLSALSSGYYKVTVYTEQDDSFSTVIKL